VPALPLTLAIGDYDHVRDLALGTVRPEGIDLNVLNLPVEEIFFRFTRHREWDASEMSFAKVVSLLSQDDRSIVPLPVFVSRVFRLSSIYVRPGGPVKTPADLRDRRIGVPECVPWILMEQVNFTERNRPVLYSKDYHRSDKIQFRVVRHRR